MKLPSRKAFDLWLDCRQSEIVGIPDNACDCPLARFFKSTGMDDGLEVRSTVVEVADDLIDLPKWAAHFVASIDAVGNTTGTLGETALNVLRSIR